VSCNTLQAKAPHGAARGIRLVFPEHADVIIAYAAKHNYQDILKEAAPLMLHKPLNEIVVNMPVNLVIPWVSTILPMAHTNHHP
jgi:hypothetical protein